jgi:hypothetical protein
VWFATIGSSVVIRSGADDGKLKRLRRDPHVVVASCDARGKPLGPPMRGAARVISGADAAAAERALTERLGTRRRLYNATRAHLLEMAYIWVDPDEGET